MARGGWVEGEGVGVQSPIARTHAGSNRRHLIRRKLEKIFQLLALLEQAVELGVVHQIDLVEQTCEKGRKGGYRLRVGFGCVRVVWLAGWAATGEKTHDHNNNNDIVTIIPPHQCG